MIRQRLPGLDLLRALAIAWVMAYHLSSSVPGLPALAELGWMGVDLFFVLSAFLVGGQVCAALQEPGGPRWRRYLLRRALCVLPAYLAVLALYLAVPAWRESPGLAPAWQFLSFTANLFSDYLHYRAFSHAWSLCVEQHFYLLLPLAAGLLARRPGVRNTALFALAVHAAAALAVAALLHFAVERPGLRLRECLEGQRVFGHRDRHDVAEAGQGRGEGQRAGARAAPTLERD
jgi:peptidoglycan/LPS O-acetylase OafA/YrhL